MSLDILVGAAGRGRPQQYQKEMDAVMPAILQDAVFSFDLHDDDEQWGPEIETCEALILTSRGLGPKAIARAKRLRFVQKLGIAAARVDAKACHERGIVLAVLSDAGHVAVAEHTIMMMLATARNLTLTRDALLRGDNPRRLKPLRTTQDQRYPNWLGWPENAFPLLGDLTLGLIGFGEIAQEVCSRARALGMNVAYTKRRRMSESEERRFGVTFRQMADLLATSNIVSLHATLPNGAPPLIGAAELDVMRPDAVLINTSRGNQIDEAALACALRTGKIGGAALDVFEIEPVGDTSLVGLPQVLATPHTAGVMATGRRFRDALLNIQAHIEGGHIHGRV
jgi:(S)-sulfolactate dehydrogenase